MDRMGCRDDYIDLMAGAAQTAADLLQRASRQPWVMSGHPVSPPMCRCSGQQLKSEISARLSVVEGFARVA
jgi:hypothetical protein